MRPRNFSTFIGFIPIEATCKAPLGNDDIVIRSALPGRELIKRHHHNLAARPPLFLAKALQISQNLIANYTISMKFYNMLTLQF